MGIKKFMAAILVAAMATIMLVGCGSSEKESAASEAPAAAEEKADTAEKKEDAPVLGITFRDTTNPTYKKSSMQCRKNAMNMESR